MARLMWRRVTMRSANNLKGSASQCPDCMAAASASASPTAIASFSFSSTSSCLNSRPYRTAMAPACSLKPLDSTLAAKANAREKKTRPPTHARKDFSNDSQPHSYTLLLGSKLGSVEAQLKRLPSRTSTFASTHSGGISWDQIKPT